MAKAAAAGRMTKSQIAAHLAERVGITKKQAAQCLEELVQLIYKQAKNGFVLPGLGKIELRERPARKMVMRFGPKKPVRKSRFPKKKVLKFRFLKAAKDAILGTGQKVKYPWVARVHSKQQRSPCSRAGSIFRLGLCCPRSEKRTGEIGCRR
jgi:DNA-binding protein HU-beta